jgi:hypothetical protein
MSIIKKINNLLIIFFTFSQIINAEEIKKIGKYKDWEAMVVTEDSGKVVLHNLYLFYKLQNQIKEMQNYL